MKPLCGGGQCSTGSSEAESTSNNYSSAKTLQRSKNEAILAIYGEDDFVNGEPLLQTRILVMVCVYLGPLACGFSSSLISVKQRQFRDPNGAPDWTDHDMLLGGLLGSALILPVFLRTIGRVKTVAAVSMILFFATILTMVSDEESSSGIGWMARLAEISVGIGLGLHLPSQQLMVAETALPHQRATLGALSYMMLALGSLLAHLLSKVVPWLAGLCVLNVVILVTHFVAIGFFHPETPRFLFAVKDRKADCANSLQWLRGKMEDIGQEYAELADSVMINGAPPGTSHFQILQDRSVLQPLITSVTLMSLTSLSGLLNITFLLRSNFRLGHQPLQPSLLQPSQTKAQSLHSTVELGNSGFVLMFVSDFFS